MRVLVIQNFDGTGLGQMETALVEAGAEIDFIEAQHGATFPETPQDYDGLIVLGGGQNALADDVAPWLPRVCQLMRGFAEAERSVLGICLGSQLLARAYNAENIIGGATEFGWTPIELNEDGVVDPLFTGVQASFPIFQWHDDTFILPRGATRLAGSDAVHNQAFRIGRATYGVQFHFEADRKLVEAWNAEFADWIAERQPGWAQRHPHDAATLGPIADAVGLTIARNFVRTIDPTFRR